LRLLTPLPIDEVLPAILASLKKVPRLVLSAPPGSGKTTRLPRALLDANMPESGEILVLEPRRLATRMAAKRVADELSEKVGQRVGYTVRFDDVSSAETRIRFVTEGVLTRRLIADPLLRGVGAVLLDEFHERHLQGDLALALLRRLTLRDRPDLLLVVMSATLGSEAVALASFLEAPHLEGGTRPFDVDVVYAEKPDDRPLETRVRLACETALTTTDGGHVLVFLPGAREIRRARDACQSLAERSGALVLPLHGDLSPEEQDRAVAPSAIRKILLSTNVAESSVTIPDVRVVVDSGLARIASSSPWTGFPELRTQPISQASAIQRAGRAGRTAHGRALRLFTRLDFDRRPERDLPELARTDLAELVLSLASLDDSISTSEFPFFELPPEAAIEAATSLLVRLGALAENRRSITPIGRRMVRFPLPPRLARLVLFADDHGAGEDGARLASLLAERSIKAPTTFRGGGAGGAGGRSRGKASHDSDALALKETLDEAISADFSAWVLRETGLDQGAVRTVARSAKELSKRLGAGGRAKQEKSLAEIDQVLAQALLVSHGDRVARRRKPGSRELVLSSGGTAVQGDESEVHEAPFVVVLQVAEGLAQRVGSAAQAVTATMVSAVEPEWLLELFPGRIQEDKEVVFVAGKDRVETTERLLYDGLVLDETRKKGDPNDEAVARTLARAALAKGLGAFAEDPAAMETFLDRVRFVASLDPGFPTFEGETLEALMTQICQGRTSFADLRDGSLSHTLSGSLTSDQRRRLADWAPEHLDLPSGRRAKIQYPVGQAPHAESRLQDFFGWTSAPTLAGGRVSVLLHLLAPNYRAVQVTTDLAGFWQRTYPTVKKELARKYPRHAWPDDPTKPLPPMRPRRDSGR
jgi:ATP-dependent helicase HrpB